MLAVVRGDAKHGLENFKAIANFIGTRNAEFRSHIEVTTEFLNQLWHEADRFDLHCMRATGTLLERILRFRTEDWALFLAFLKLGCSSAVRQYIDGWIAGHFLNANAVADAAAEIEFFLREA